MSQLSFNTTFTVNANSETLERNKAFPGVDLEKKKFFGNGPDSFISGICAMPMGGIENYRIMLRVDRFNQTLLTIT